MKPIDPVQVQTIPTIVHVHATAPGQVWGPRVVANPELIYIVSGMFRYQTAALDLILVPDQVLFIPVATVHTFAAHSVEPGRIAVVHFDLVYGELDFAAVLANLAVSPRPVINAGKDRRLYQLFSNCAEEFAGTSAYRQALANCLCRELWLRMCQRWRQSLDQALSQRLRQMLQFLDTHCCSTVSRQDLSARFHLTPEHVNALFRRELQTTPTEYVQRRRVHHAYALLVEQNLSVAQTAQRLGFCDAFYFAKVFKKYTGMSPSALKGSRRGVCST